MAPSFEKYDDDAWEFGDDIFRAWKKKLFNKELYYEIVDIVKEHHMAGDVLELCPPDRGSFNVHYRVRFADDTSALMRIPIPEYLRIAEEKLLGELATMRHIRDNTTIPIPFVLYHGPREECPSALGPFAVMEWVENSRDLVDVLNTPGLTDGNSAVLNPNIDELVLEYAYGWMADTLLQLFKCNLPAIGALGFQDGEEDEVEVRARPLSMNLLMLGSNARVPHFELPSSSKVFNNSSEYYAALADMHMQQLSYQRNGAIESADDCRKKYIARQLFRKLASEGRLANSDFDNGPFKLWCEDLRPTNVLVDNDDKLAAVIDWEFSYAAPAEFTFSPPWWLLLEAPEDWKEGLDDWAAHYEKRLATFLRALEAKEREFIEQGRLGESDLLSTRMRESWKSGGFWVTYAARKSWAFDGIYWRFLDEKFFGKNESGDFMERLKLLSPEQVVAMGPFVERKIREKEERTLADWYEPGAEAKLPPNILLP